MVPDMNVGNRNILDIQQILDINSANWYTLI